MLSAMAARMATSVGLTILLGRNLTPRQFGFFALVATVFGLAHELTDMGTGNVAVRVAARTRTGERVMLETLLGLRLALSQIAALACVVLALAQDYAWERNLLLATAIVVGFSYVSAFSMVFQLRQAQAIPAMLSVGVQVGAFALTGLLLLFGVSQDLFAAVLVLREAVVVVGMRQFGGRMLGYRPRANFSREAMRPFLGKAVIVAVGTLFYHLQFQGGPFFIEFLRPSEELGAFAAALRPMVPLLFVPWVIMLPLVPVLSWLAVQQPSGFRDQAKGALDISVGLGAVVAVACGMLAAPALHFLYGARFDAGPLSAVAALQWLALPLGCSFATAAISTVLLADNREWDLLLISAGGVVVYALGNLWLLPRYGFTGSAMATALSVSVVTLAGLVQMAHGTGDFAPGPRTILIAAPAAALAAALQIVCGPAIVQLAAGAALSVMAVVAVWWFPGLPGYRMEQAAVSRRLLADA